MNIRLYFSLLFFLLSSSPTLSAQKSTTNDDNGSAKEALLITSVTESDGINSAYHYGSTQGGMLLYINGYGFDKNQIENNIVFIGDYPCQVESATKSQIKCRTTAFQSYADSTTYLKVSVSVGSSLVSYNNFYFSYYKYSTPVIQDIFPSTFYGNSEIKVFGKHKISELGNGKDSHGNPFSVFIGESPCGRTGYSKETIGGDTNHFLTCTLTSKQQAGKYKIREWSSKGYAYHSQRLIRKSLSTGEDYEIVILPLITHVTPSSGTAQKINIHGIGFPDDEGRVKVYVNRKNCPVSDSKYNKVECNLLSSPGSSLKLLTNTTGVQKKGYIGGAGWNYEQYSGLFSGDMKTIKSVLPSFIAPSPTKTGVQLELQTGSHLANDRCFSVYKGYFRAPRTGDYVFRGFADQKFALYLSPAFGSAEISNDATPILWANSETGNISHAIFLKDKIISDNFFMNEGEHYYMELFHSQSHYYNYQLFGGYLKISAEIPNNSSAPGEVYAVARFMTSFDPDPQIIQFTQEGAESGRIVLNLVRLNSNFQITYNYTYSISYNATIEEFLSALRSCSGYYEYPIDGERLIYDMSDTQITNLSNATPYKFVWRIYIYKARSQAHLDETFDIAYDVVGRQYFTQARVQAFSPLISGTFQIEIGGLALQASLNNTNFAYDVSASTVEKNLRKIAGFQGVTVTRQGDPQYSANWTIFFTNYAQEPPTPTFTTNELIGGKDGTSPTITVTFLRHYQNRIVFDVLDEQFLFQPSDTPNILVVVDNELTSVCGNNCSFTYLEEPPIITAAALTNDAWLNITLMIPSSSSTKISDLTITESNYGSTCMIPNNQTLPTFKCKLETNEDGTLKANAGELKFTIFVTEIGYIEAASNVTPIVIPLTVTNIMPLSGNQNGGNQAILNGHGFPFHKQQLNITICEQQVQIKEMNNTHVTVIIPSCSTLGNETVKIEFGSESNQDMIYSYVAPLPSQIITISQIVPNSVCPAIKKAIQIHGSGFGSNRSLISVTMKHMSSKKQYQLKILNMSDTMLKVGFPGAPKGRYSIKVTNPGVAVSIVNSANANILTAEVVIESIRPSTGSLNGGTRLAITGRNFPPDNSEILVNVGEKANTFCSIQSVNNTQIVCITPSKPMSYLSLSQTLYVSVKLTEDATCEDSLTNCTFSFVSSADYVGPEIISLNKNKFQSNVDVIEITTSNSTGWESGFQLVFKNIGTGKQISASSPFPGHTSSMLPYTINFESGMYEVSIRTSIGDSNKMAITRSMGLIPSSINVSMNGGIIGFPGFGLSSSVENPLFKYTQLTSSVIPAPSFNILESNPNKVIIEFKKVHPSAFSLSSFIVKLTVRGPINQQQIDISFNNVNLSSLTLSHTPLIDGKVNVTINCAYSVSAIIIRSISTTTFIQNVTNWTQASNNINFTAEIRPGGYTVELNILNISSKGWYTAASPLKLVLPAATAQNSAATFGTNGAQYVINQRTSEGAILIVDGKIATFYAYQSLTTVFYIPSFPSPPLSATNSSSCSSDANNNGVGKDLLRQILDLGYEFDYISDKGADEQKAFDNRRGNNEQYVSNSQTACYVGISVGGQISLFLKSVQVDLGHDRVEDFYGVEFEGSADGINWEKIFSIPAQQQSTINFHRHVHFHQNLSCLYKKIRMHDFRALSKCSVNKITFKGELVLTSQSSAHTVQLYDGFNNLTLDNAILFEEQRTPIVELVSPRTGSYLGGYNLTISGQKFSGTVAVFIDTVECQVYFSNSTAIVCEVQQRPDELNFEDFQVLVNGSYAIIEDRFRYVMRWSDEATWGVDFRPSDGDLVYVPKGQVLWVDQSTPQLKGIVVDGSIIFADESDMTVTTDFLLVNKGKFTAGKKERPYQHQLTFNLTGSKNSPQQPNYGVKVIACQACQFDMHGLDTGFGGQKWTQVASTISPGDFKLAVEINISSLQAAALIGKNIVVASTSANYWQAEVKKISHVLGGEIFVSSSFEYEHLSITLQDGTQIKAEVGLLSSNIRVQGFDNSENEKYGGKIMVRGNPQLDSSYFHLANVELTKCGQPTKYGHNCISVMYDGVASSSYVKNNLLYSTYARPISVPNFILDFTVAGNVIYNGVGHNIFFQASHSGTNTIESNLIINPISTWRMSQTDATAAGIKLMSPSNRLIGNHIAGSQYMGIWYDLSSRHGQPFCGWTMPTEPGSDNWVHGASLYGVYIDKLGSRSLSCGQIPLDSTNISTISYKSILKGFILYRNYYGMYIESSGNTLVTNSTFADNYLHFKADNVQLSRQAGRLQNSSFLSHIKNNESSFSTSIFIQLPCSDDFVMNKLSFYGSNLSTTILSTCTPAGLFSYYYADADEVHISNVSYHSFSGKFIQYNFDKKTVIYDEDGTFAQKPNAQTIVYKDFNYLKQAACIAPPDQQRWQFAMLCNTDNVTVKVLKIYYYLTYGTSFEVRRIANVTAVSNETYTYFQYRAREFEIPFITNRYYEFYIQGFDFDELKISPTKLYKLSDGGIVLKQHYVNNRQLYDVSTYENSIKVTPPVHIQNGTGLNSSTCGLGDFYHDNANRVFAVCSSGIHFKPYNYLRALPIYCRYECPDNADQGQGDGCFSSVRVESNLRMWSNVTMWPNGRLPSEGDTVLIKPEWKVVLDVDPPILNYLQIKGTLLIPNDRGDVLIQANAIWVKGALKAGTSSSPFTNKLTIRIFGSSTDRGITVDPLETGNKLLVVTGLLSLYGNSPATTWTQLIETALPRANSIKVFRSTGWRMGDKLVISPSFADHREFEYVTITSISDNIVSFEPSLNFTHYGSSTSTVTKFGKTLDARTTIGHLSRNIRIESGGSSNWGFRLLCYGYLECNQLKIGVIKLSGVELANGGQSHPTKPKPTVHLKRMTLGLAQSEILESTFHNCKSRCLIIDNVKNVKINNNVFASATNLHVEIVGKSIANILFSYNLMIDAHSNDQVSLTQTKVACFEWKEAVYQANTGNSSIQNNLCQGSEGSGFSRKYEACNLVQNSVYNNNAVGSSTLGYLLHDGDGACSIAEGLMAHNCKVAVIGNPKSVVNLKYNKLIIIDSKVGISLRFTSRGTDLTAFLTNSYISAIERPTCSSCYNSSACRNMTAVSMLVTMERSAWNNQFSYNQSLVQSVGQATFDSKAFVINSTFKNYKINYSQSHLGSCQNNFIFQAPESASELIGSMHLFNTNCADCDLDATAYFMSPLSTEAGELAPCGEFQCTGKSNYFIEDHDGVAFNGGSFVPSSEMAQFLKENNECEWHEKSNGYYCQSVSIYALEFESISPDYNSLVGWPVYLSPIEYSENMTAFSNISAMNSTSNAEWVSKINGFKEWNYKNGVPQYTRLNRFISLLLANQTYNLTFDAVPPKDLRFQLQKKTISAPASNDWAILRAYYPIPNSIRVQVGGNVIEPITILDMNQEDPLLSMTDICGANKFYYRNRTLDFVITNSPNCLVRLTITNSIQLTAKFEMSIDQFYEIDGKTKFIDRMVALLGIADRSRVKIVGIYRGSVVIDSFIEDENIVSEDNATAASYSTQADGIISLQKRINQVYASGAVEQSMAAAGFGPVIIFFSNVRLYDSPTPEGIKENSETQSKDNILLIAGLGGSIVAILLIVVAGIYLRRRHRIANELHLYEMELSDKTMAKKRNCESNLSIVDLT